MSEFVSFTMKHSGCLIKTSVNLIYAIAILSTYNLISCMMS